MALYYGVKVSEYESKNYANQQEANCHIVGLETSEDLTKELDEVMCPNPDPIIDVQQYGPKPTPRKWYRDNI